MGKKNVSILFVLHGLQIPTRLLSVVSAAVYTLQCMDSATCVVLAFVEITYLALRKNQFWNLFCVCFMILADFQGLN